ncbi:MAG: ribonuclease [Clostridiales bacterium]|jgi:membrane protein|nr:ribonuclease [Clostridiales bacterium]
MIIINKIIIFIAKLLKRGKRDNISAVSSQVAYFLFLSIFPLLMFVLSIIQYTPITRAEVLIKMQPFFPVAVNNIIFSVVNDISVGKSNLVLSVTFLGTLWAMSKGTLAIINGINVAHGIEEKRNYFHTRLIAALYTLAFVFILIFSLTIIVFGNKVLSLIAVRFSLTEKLILTISSLRFVFTTLALLGFFTLIYRFLPSAKYKIKSILPGALFSAVAWMVTSFIFSVYVDSASNFSYMYGSLAGIVITLLWLYLLANIVIIGAEINAILMPEYKVVRGLTK